MKPRYDVYYYNDLLATFYENGPARDFIQDRINAGADDEAFAVIKDGNALIVEIQKIVTIGGY